MTDDEACERLDNGRLGRVQSLVRAFGMLDLLAAHDEGLTLTEIARLVKLPRSTAHRLLTTMSSLQYIEFDSESNRWLIGVRAFKVGSAFAQTRDLVRLGRPIMRVLMIEARETINMSVIDSGGVRLMSQLEPMRMGRALTRPGRHLPVHATASGKCMLAHWNSGELNDFLETAVLASRTAFSITSASALVRQLTEIKSCGFAIDDQEHTMGVRCVAAPVFDSNGAPRAALSISGPIERLSGKRLTKLGDTLVLAAKQMTLDIGGHLAA